MLKIKINEDWYIALEANGKKVCCIEPIEYDWRHIRNVRLGDVKVFSVMQITEMSYCNCDQAYIDDKAVRKYILEQMNYD